MPEPATGQESQPAAFDLIGSSLAEQPFFGVYLLQDGRFVYVNERFAQILGYTVDEVMQLPSVLDTVYEDDREMVREKIRSRLDGEVEQIRYSLRGRRKDGSPVELEVQGRRVLHDGRPAVAGIQFDVSDRARELRTYHARQKAEALGAMAAGVAHDFNNVLAAIGTTADLIAQEVEGRTAEDVAEIREAVQRGARLCQRLMSFGAEVRGPEASASAGDVLSGLAPILERLLGRRKVRLSVHVPAGLPRVRVGSAEVEQIVMNLVVNAGDASPEGGEVELLAALDESAAERRVLLEVRDRGAGIAPEHLGRIFEHYFTTKGDRGNGLGLGTVWQIVTSAGGEVKVDSKLGQGSTFAVLLPIERRRTSRWPPSEPSTLNRAWFQRTGRGMEPSGDRGRVATER
jgi:two-component system cell cycle sensor histidine kinase/response regulator CckA